jgi:hypothetical protein
MTNFPPPAGETREGRFIKWTFRLTTMVPARLLFREALLLLRVSFGQSDGQSEVQNEEIHIVC